MPVLPRGGDALAGVGDARWPSQDPVPSALCAEGATGMPWPAGPRCPAARGRAGSESTCSGAAGSPAAGLTRSLPLPGSHPWRSSVELGEEWDGWAIPPRALGVPTPYHQWREGSDSQSRGLGLAPHTTHHTHPGSSVKLRLGTTSPDPGSSIHLIFLPFPSSWPVGISTHLHLPEAHWRAL